MERMKCHDLSWISLDVTEFLIYKFDSSMSSYMLKMKDLCDDTSLSKKGRNDCA